MIVFNKNVYDLSSKPLKPITYSQSWPGNAASEVNPYDLILSTLVSDRKIFNDLTHRDAEKIDQHLFTLFPHASRFGNVTLLNSISKRLLEGLVNPNDWFWLNSYHFCYLYDTLSSMIEDYSYSDHNQRLELIPELNGDGIDFNWFLNTYFFHTAFLIDQDRYNDMPSEKKESLEKWSPHLFGVINALTPTEEEIQLIKINQNPYQDSKAT